MDITIIGTGNMARGIATRALAGGHTVTLLGREPEKAQALAGELSGDVRAGTVGDPLSGDLLDVNVDLAADVNLAAPIDGAVAANANVAAPIDAAVAANVGSIDSAATAVAQQDAIITQDINADATANADQQSDITQ